MTTNESLVKRGWILLTIPPFLLALVSLIFGVILYATASGDRSEIPKGFQTFMPLILTINHISLFIILWSFLKKDGLNFKSIGWIFDKSKLYLEIVAGLSLAILLFFYNQLVIEPLQQLYRGSQMDFGATIALRETVNWPMFIAASTLPIVEESIYRGYAFKAFNGNYSQPFTIIISSLLFGALHWGLGGLTSLLIVTFGIFYSLVFIQRKRNLVAITISHCVYNAMVLIFV